MKGGIGFYAIKRKGASDMIFRAPYPDDFPHPKRGDKNGLRAVSVAASMAAQILFEHLNFIVAPTKPPFRGGVLIHSRREDRIAVASEDIALASEGFAPDTFVAAVILDSVVAARKPDFDRVSMSVMKNWYRWNFTWSAKIYRQDGMPPISKPKVGVLFTPAFEPYFPFEFTEIIPPISLSVRAHQHALARAHKKTNCGFVSSPWDFGRYLAPENRIE